MESNVAELSIFDRLMAWFELHKREVSWGTLVVLAAGLGIGFYFWHQHDLEDRANEALSRAASAAAGASERGMTPETLLKIAGEYPKTDAGARALLLAAGALYSQGKYSDSKAQFERYFQEYRDSPFTAQALLGVAACLEAQGQTQEAISAYNNIVQHYSRENVAPQAKLALAALYEGQGKWDQAKDLYLDLTRNQYGSISQEAGIHLQALLVKHPELIPSRPALTNAPPLALPPS